MYLRRATRFTFTCVAYYMVAKCSLSHTLRRPALYIRCRTGYQMNIFLTFFPKSHSFGNCLKAPPSGCMGSVGVLRTFKGLGSVSNLKHDSGFGILERQRMKSRMSGAATTDLLTLLLND